MTTTSGSATIFEALDWVRNASFADLHYHISYFVDPERVPSLYISTLTNSQQTICCRFFLLAYFVTGGREAPREMQLRAALATYENRDSAVIAGTGSGKTLIIALLILSDKPSDGTTITISPLKRLQVTQTADFVRKYRIKTMAINDDTSRTQSFWDEMVFNSKTKTPGSTRHFIVTTEQMFKSKEGHLSRFGHLIRTLAFRKTIKRVFVDEAHFIYFAGASRYKIPAFRPSWGRLNEIQIFLPSIPWQILTATSPPHVLSVIEAAVLKPGYELIRITSNRPNAIYVTHCVVKSLDVMENYDCFLADPPAHQRKVLLFFNNRNLGRRVTTYLNNKLPEDQRFKGLVKHYDSIMSKEYLEKVHSDFAQEGGTCKILCATSAEAVGKVYHLARSTIG
ncbi:P-loop containing nucleoside triphosphate hydrolase protein [Armillaria nabsnona]|nr:P-loop containing nucleoside triphosphate hydrolase protein [Armillaria nabsnona]